MPPTRIPKPGSVEVGPEKVDGETRIRRSVLARDKLVTQPWEGIDTVYDVLMYAARTHGTRQSYGSRDVVEIHEEEKEVTKVVGGKEVKEKKTWKYFQLSDYKYLTFQQVKDAAVEVAGALLELGVQKTDVVNIYAATTPSWQMISYGCAIIATAIATAYETLGESGLQHALNEPECVAMFTNAELLKVVANVAPNVPSLRVVIYDGKADEALLEKIRTAREGVRVLHLDELRQLGKGASEETLKARRPVPEDTACIMYTSGTTGPPKGVMISHANAIASVGAVYTYIGHHLKPDDAYLAYLPLSHVLEYIVEMCLFFVGMKFGYARVKTLMDTSVRNCLGDIRAFQPTIMVGVPQVWETIRKGIEGKVNQGGSFKKGMFNASVSIKKAGVPGLSELADSAVFSQVRAATGGRLRLALSGGAALSIETQEFLSLALVKMVPGYGLTETVGMTTVFPPEYSGFGEVGLPVPSMEIKLKDVPEANYLSTNNPPQGEVWVRGASLTKGYFKRDDLNKDPTIFTPDGWFRTGDVGQWNPDGTLSLIDRIKNLVKLSGGEYIALERLESVYKSCNLVANVCVHAHPDAKQPIAIIIPHEQNLRYALESKSLGLSVHTGLPDLCKDDRVRELVMKECNAVGKKNGFKPMEILDGIILTADEWTPESGLVTAAQKVQRRKVAERYADEIKAIYKPI
ncbi:long-chain-fatty-acid-CoA-ligase [Fomitopsis serialis]|uniref:long-chain-fatty-acid-CoA-ligase n=1 Tax=Fomitopsis serialis TaxID=139415 RepID=UPI0020089A0F|nr:long-chain-fatty-acid-CoA-ligase [Neoantrodia serialis]XP_047895396.1 long-chain-fatty-acid-CoA-ligase [Neoantrodia serialis]KAH9918460.1 long-chain-fatty-acid-CoA-ligase [Neoantrodia serialis]KAH9929403.1 long-chain-fatty-acid-CoA-ligase [Neoantrodia serialis]